MSTDAINAVLSDSTTVDLIEISPLLCADARRTILLRDVRTVGVANALAPSRR